MFSSLLPKPKHAPYDPSLNVRVSRTTSRHSSQLLHLPKSSNKTIIDNPHTNNTISKLHLNPDGTLDYNLTIASATGSNVQASYEDTIALKKRFPKLKHHFPRYDLHTSPDSSLQKTVRETKKAIAALMNRGAGSSSKSTNEVSYVKYENNSLVEGEDRGRVIQIREFQEDPMLPPKFKLRKNRHKEPSPPPPILKNTNASQTKLTKEDREKWNIPAAISNWKNNQGFTISLDKRVMAANGGKEEEVPDLNIEKFGKLSSALENADKEAREEIRIRNEMMRELAIKEKQEKEAKLRELAEATRRERGKRANHDGGSDWKRRK
ncbi:uncharacterized protein CANTADRAFT_43791 [Suhomyces tanzawaensis NRRL Y-17324]|uniref:Pre-mRNA-processing protein 45 n=1 Tax=Suhomyces tanzawaensis NRRL Y-17324 TaxID=984487 RepID=A0A1E4SQZ6_9ASCO|nr:uncharacterized protein CANTADRAFT_43791 [Suhomyces tanzawaensis NRRL Y-17324]ODV81918.1 hypothetical protein CANTADRAFT_43791 [Suhomyces tanzawaensis NRRL Y-17324]